MKGRWRAAGAAACVWAATAAAASAQETTAFREMPTGALLELYADVGDALRDRGLLEAASSEAQLYAEHLVIVSMGPAAEGLRIVGVRERVPGNARRGMVSAPVVDLREAGDGGDVAVVLFSFDFQIVRGATVSVATVLGLAGDGDAVRLDDALWRADGVRDMTAALFQAAQPQAQ